ncbi:MAG: gst [Hydrocarboniphaga sp.]|uniref:glutathione S-transferase family protein n=1 Tax=Hydrocarboniphaga sp. TaxID=2033016 RepID=UPI0026271D58|nr:glutathione S-transferase family protein [Hydrocarboniphaga sp.]MDB5970158.1 gst [Hydrocarboniphaga sp.]
MIELYHCQDARSFRCLWMLEEIQQPYTLKPLQYPPKLTAPEYLKINPAGTVPLLLDEDAVMFESSAILQYLAVRYAPDQLAVSSADAAYAGWLNWLHFGEATLTVPLGTMFRYAYTEPEARRQPAVVADQRAVHLDRLQLVAKALQGHDYLCADRFTAADISVGYALLLGRTLGLHGEYPDTVLDYWKRLQERPAFKAAKAAQKQAFAPASA